jgi:hypothetical protein
MRIPEHCLDRLLAAGLLVSEPFVPNHLAFPDGVTIGKPSTVAGNSIPGRTGHWGTSGATVDSPCPRLHFADGSWVVTVHEYIPGPGPGDFVNRWRTCEEAVADVIDYLLGDLARMSVKRQEREEHLARLELPDPNKQERP